VEGYQLLDLRDNILLLSTPILILWETNNWVWTSSTIASMILRQWHRNGYYSKGLGSQVRKRIWHFQRRHSLGRVHHGPEHQDIDPLTSEWNHSAIERSARNITKYQLMREERQEFVSRLAHCSAGNVTCGSSVEIQHLSVAAAPADALPTQYYSCSCWNL
jgi:hypothetical protein